jgi:hypothetical protein
MCLKNQILSKLKRPGNEVVVETFNIFKTFSHDHLRTLQTWYFRYPARKTLRIILSASISNYAYDFVLLCYSTFKLKCAPRWIHRSKGVGGTGGTSPPNFFKELKVPFFVTKRALFVTKSALFVQANVAVNTKLTSKVPFLFGNFQVF